jgi:hypothetical protein
VFIGRDRVPEIAQWLLKQWGGAKPFVEALEKEMARDPGQLTGTDGRLLRRPTPRELMDAAAEQFREMNATLDPNRFVADQWFDAEVTKEHMQKALESLPSIGAGNFAVCSSVPPAAEKAREETFVARWYLTPEEVKAELGRAPTTPSPPTAETLSAMADNVEAWMAKAALVEDDVIVATLAGYEALAAVKIKDSCGAMTDEMKRVIRAEQLAKLAPEIEAMAERGDLAANSWLKWYHAHQASRAAITTNAVPTGFCKCGTKLQSQSSIEAGACVACRDKQRRIGTT